MSHQSKSKGKGIGATSFFDLKAELSKQEAEFSKKKAAGESTRVVGGVPRPAKKPTVWARQNKGVAARASRDAELEAVDKPTLESARSILERKAKMYNQLKKGKSGGLNDAQYDALLVDFDAAGPSNYDDSDSEDVDSTADHPASGDNSDPLLEYEDEFGRIRKARKSCIPRHLLPKEHRELPVEEDEIIYNPEGHFPVYVPTDERIQEIETKYAESNNPLVDRYDSTRENRAKGAGFYQFSNDEETRKEQMEALKQARTETEKARQETGAMDLKPGDVEGMREGEGEGASKLNVGSRAMEKRRKELEERREFIKSKRRKVQHLRSNEGGGNEDSGEIGPQLPPAVSAVSQVLHAYPASPPVSQEPLDPFAVLEASIPPAPSGPSKVKDKNKAEPVNEADAFLSLLEEEFLGSKGKKKQG